MKHEKWMLVSIAFLLLSTLLWGCSRPNQKPTEIQEKLVVYTSFYPMYDFAKNIGKDKIDLRLMVPPGVEAHDWEPTPKLMGELEKADVFIYNGLEMEPWAEKLINSIDNKKLIILKASEGLDLLKSEEGHEDEEDEEHEEHGEFNPHVWLDPMNAMKQAANIRDAFIKADNVNKETYESNYREFADKLMSLNDRFEEELSGLTRNEIVVTHEAFGYLANKYGLQEVAITGLSPQEEPSAAKMAQITRFIEAKDVKVIFFETLTNSRLADVLAQETGVETAVLNPIEGLTEQEIKEGKDYLSVMEDNLQALKQALGD